MEQRQDMEQQQNLVQRFIQRFLFGFEWLFLKSDYHWLYAPLVGVLLGWWVSLAQHRPMFILAVAYNEMSERGTQGEWAWMFAATLTFLMVSLIVQWRWLHLLAVAASWLLCLFIAYMSATSILETTGVLQSPGAWIHGCIGLTSLVIWCRYIGEHIAELKRPFVRLRRWLVCFHAWMQQCRR